MWNWERCSVWATGHTLEREGCHPELLHFHFSLPALLTDSHLIPPILYWTLMIKFRQCFRSAATTSISFHFTSPFCKSFCISGFSWSVSCALSSRCSPRHVPQLVIRVYSLPIWSFVCWLLHAMVLILLHSQLCSKYQLTATQKGRGHPDISTIVGSDLQHGILVKWPHHCQLLL